MTSEKFLHRLVLPSVRLSDAGEYTAVGGASMSKAHLGVEGRDVKISEPADRNIAVSIEGLIDQRQLKMIKKSFTNSFNDASL